MILVDSGVWIDRLANRETPQTTTLARLLAMGRRVAIGDLIVAEVLQGTRSERDFHFTAARLSIFEQVQISDHAVAIAAARNYRILRARGITIRKTIDTLIATRCILDGLPLLYSDRDFDPFVEHLGLMSAMTDFTGVN